MFAYIKEEMYNDSNYKGKTVMRKEMKRYYSDYNRIMSLIYEDQPISPQTEREIVFIPERIRSIRSLGRGVSSAKRSHFQAAGKADGRL